MKKISKSISKSRRRTYFKKYVWVISILVLMILVYVFGLQQYLKLENIQGVSNQLQSKTLSHQLIAPFFFILIYIVTVALSLPGATILSLVGGFLFGVYFGTLYTVIGATIGAACIFLAVKTAFADRLKNEPNRF